MNAFLNFIEKILTWFFSLAFGALLIYGVIRYNAHRQHQSDPWLQAQKQNTAAAYLAFLRECRSCPQEAAAEKALDDLQRPLGLLARMHRGHLSERAMISLPAFSPDNRELLATGGTGPDFWDVETGRRHSHGAKTFAKDGARKVDALDYAPDGRRIAAGQSGVQSGRLLIWDLVTEALVNAREVEASNVKGVQFSPDGVWLGWMGDGPVGIWDPVAGTFLRATHAEVSSMAFRPAGDGVSHFLTAGGRDLRTWEPATMELLKEQHFDSDRPLLGLSRNGRLIAFTDGKVLDLWDTATGKMVASIRDLEGTILSFCVESSTGRVVIGTQTGMLYLWHPYTSTVPEGQVPAHRGPVEALACARQGRVTSISWDAAKVWNIDRLVTDKAEPRATR
ncbi:MAG: WD40 repeat domain-containing protein [Methylococcaceae bacterium]|jgi:WD40 repeat protein